MRKVFSLLLTAALLAANAPAAAALSASPPEPLTRKTRPTTRLRVNLAVTGDIPSATAISVKQAPYNAAGNGTANDTPAIQSVINTACAAGGAAVFFPPGIYKVTVSGSRALYVGCSNVTLVGVKGVSRIAMASAAGDTLQIGTAGGSADANQCELAGLVFEPSVARTSGSEVFAPAVNNLTVRNVKLKGFYRGFYLGAPQGSTHVQFDNVWAEDFTNFAYMVRVIGGTFVGVQTWGRRANSVNLHLDGYCEGLVFTSCLFFNDYAGTPSGSYNLVIAADVVSRPSQFNEFIGCYFDWGNYAVVATNAYSYTFTDCWFKGRTDSGVLLESTAHEFTFKGCDFFNSAGPGLYINGGTGHVVTGNRVLNNAVSVAGSAGVRIAAGSSGIVITSNRIGRSAAGRVSDAGLGAQGYGVWIEAGVTSFVVKDNNMLGNVTGAVNNLAGTSAVKIVSDNLF
jgi:hypothetical protein